MEPGSDRRNSEHIPSSLTKWISNAPTSLRRIFASLYLLQKICNLILLIQTQCLDLRISQSLEINGSVTVELESVCFHTVMPYPGVVVVVGDNEREILERTEGSPHRAIP